ncbi:hypothetical protein FISHEDRAFT_47446, partial [Fistulina hepatica ATCC 64428]
MATARVLHSGSPDPPKDTEETYTDRRQISACLLWVYVSTAWAKGRRGVQYIWLDEFCISDLVTENIPDELVQKQRSDELSVLSDVFRHASAVCVCCHVPQCTHTSSRCPWTERIFTLSEVLHAASVEILTCVVSPQDGVQGQWKWNLIERSPSRTFHEKIKAEAEAEEKPLWHLSAVMQHMTNAGSMPWQMAINALVIEVIRRDIATGFHDHKYLGKALNGLLPRRARRQDLRREDGWADFAWLLELNQGFYNAAALASACCLNDTRSTASWLGSPIQPHEGNERLEPIVSAIPV